MVLIQGSRYISECAIKSCMILEGKKIKGNIYKLQSSAIVGGAMGGSTSAGETGIAPVSPSFHGMSRFLGDRLNSSI